jgi:tRNA 2-selenouridine synthase
MKPLEINPQELIELLPLRRKWGKSTAIDGLVDVRSPGEFEAGQLPGFANIPILNNEERSQVGTTYKTAGKEAAIKLGHQLVDPHKQNLLDAWTKAIRPSSSSQAIFMCWRGGLRSNTSAQWWSEGRSHNVFTVKGGYKAVRGILLQQLDSPPSLIVLTGLTGSGKTVLIQKTPEVSIDLEGLALHKGSAFGRDLNGPQPVQATFENHLGLSLFRARNLALVEDESARIGDVQLSSNLKNKMKSSPIIVLEASLLERAQRIFEEYVTMPLSSGFHPEYLCQRYLDNIQRIHRKLGGLAAEQISRQIQDSFKGQNDFDAHSGWIQTLLKNYYDPMYEHALHQQERPMLFRGDHNECLNYIQTKLIPKTLD